MGLRSYRRKRDFRRTPEPEGKPARRRGRSFVVQKHAARSLHHDFRLELDGVLLSWAVPKGPPTKPGEKVLAVRTEDHPLEYGDFEGVIPAGQYGGGTVMVWDRGTWRSEGSARAAIKQGKLTFQLDGERLRGRWSLVRMAPTAKESGESWLLIKRTDRGERGRTAQPELDRSVATGRSMAQIRRAADRQWSSTDGEPANAATPTRRAARAPAPSAGRRRARRRRAPDADPTALPGAQQRSQSRRLRPQLATLVSEAPAGDDWLHEVKFDGYRLLAFLAHGRVRLLTRTGQDWTSRFPAVAAAVAELPVEDAVLDGEVVSLRPDGVSDFQALQNSMSGGDDSTIAFFAFDLPHCRGYDLTGCPLLARKQLLEQLLAHVPRRVLRYSDHVVGQGPVFFAQACEMGLEGTVSKRVHARYEPRRTRTWVKTKCRRRQELVVVGYTDPAGSRHHLGALLLAVYDAGELRYAGKVGTGFTERSLRELAARLRPLTTDALPLAKPPRLRRVHWVRPECVVEVSFTEWTSDGRLRHPSFEGVRDDKPAADVRREHPREAASNPKAKATTVSPKAQATTASPKAKATTVSPKAKATTVSPKAKATTVSPKAQAAVGSVAGVRLSHPDRVVYAEQGISKLDLARYYEAVAERILPHIQGRPLTLLRCPRGRSAKCFYQKHVTETLPPPVRAIRIAERKGESADYISVDDLPGLITLVQFGALELHPWGCRGDRLDRPDRIVIDLDPGPGVAWQSVVDAALGLRAILDELELASFPRTTGGKGLHVVLPIERRSSWEEAKTFARNLVEGLARTAKDRFVLTASKAQRQGRIYLDYLRNDRGATAVASWSSRAREGAPVAMPLRWQEVSSISGSQAFTVQSAPQRARHDPWAGFFDVHQTLTAKVRRGVANL